MTSPHALAYWIGSTSNNPFRFSVYSQLLCYSAVQTSRGFLKKEKNICIMQNAMKKQKYLEKNSF